MDVLPVYINNYAKFCVELEKLTYIFIDEYTKAKGTKNETDCKTFWTAYLLALCYSINTVLFDTHTTNIRSHVRILEDKNYVKAISLVGDDIIDQELTPIPEGKGMIAAAYKNRTSLVQSLNPHDHYSAKNDSRWDDYIAFAIDCSESESSPALSMAISIANSERHREYIYFLNYMKIEEKVNFSINTVNRICSIHDYIAEWRKTNNAE